MTSDDAQAAPRGDARLPLEMQQVKLDRDGVPHNIGWMQAASRDKLQQHANKADDAWQDAMKRQLGPDRGNRELWWHDRIDDELRRRDGWTDAHLDRLQERMDTRRAREADPGLSGRVYRALYRLRDDRDVARDMDPIDRYGPHKGHPRDERER